MTPESAATSHAVATPPPEEIAQALPLPLDLPSTPAAAADATAVLGAEPLSPFAKLAVPILMPLVGIAVIGLVMVYSASGVYFENYYLLRQAGWFVLGALAATGAAFFRLELVTRRPVRLHLLTIGLLLAVFLPGIGNSVNGAARWIRLGPLGFQPSDFVKVLSVLYFSAWLDRNPITPGNVRVRLPQAGLHFAPVAILILAEPDFGTTIYISLLVTILLLVAGTPARILLAGMLIVAPVVSGVMFFKFDHVKRRIDVFLDPSADPSGKGHQIRQSHIALGSGGWSGEGLGESRQVRGFLPERSTDFIFAIAGEELGFVGTASILGLVGVFGWGCFNLMRRTRSPFELYLVTGLGALIVIQAVFNAAVVTGSMPTTGIPFPLLSFGGSSAMTVCVAAGLILNVARRVAAAGPVIDTRLA